MTSPPSPDDAALRESEERYRLLFEASPRPMWVYEAETLRFLAVNDAAICQYGYSREEFLSMTLRDLRPAEDVPAMERVTAAIDTAYNPSGIWRHRRRDGSLMDVEITSHSIVFDGRRARLVLITDVTAQRAAEEALRASELELRAVFDAMTDVVIVFDAEARHVKIAPTRPESVLQSPESVIGKRVRDVLPAELAAYCERAIAEAIATGGPVQVDYELDVGGETRWFSGSVTRMQGAETAPRTAEEPVPPAPRALWVARDVTARKQLEAQLRQAQKMEAVGLLAGGIAHDFNNLLTVITAYGQLLREEFPEGDSRRDEVDEVLKAASRGAALTRQLLAFGRKQVMRPRVLDVNGVVAGIRPMLARLLGADVTFLTRLAPTLDPVEADPGQLEQVLLNLIANAGDAMPGGGTVSVETANAELDAAAVRPHPGLAPGRYVLIAVRDTGVGMDEVTRARVFEPFFTTKETGKGTGLGLATVYGIVKQSGGYVSVESAPGSGTTFTVYLPCAAAGDEPSPAGPRGPNEESSPSSRSYSAASVR